MIGMKFSIPGQRPAKPFLSLKKITQNKASKKSFI